ncbi:GMC oxidoreductase [Mycena rosella]|uniref:GMC oxidoreductase n=1 Tax=Mycena rosella TaxID=1033263 RepID=A0AAD7C3B0_MYCRO|nr:GMC oxidoreductase [Mycena rosella]
MSDLKFYPEDVVDKSFDYVICGGGTAGLALAARLTENPDITVAVLEAGEHNIGESLIDVPGQFGQTFGNPKVFNEVVTQFLFNHLCRWTKPPAGDVDAIEALGNPGWNWAEYSKYTRISETFHIAQKEQSDLYPHTHNFAFRGESGPIQVTVPHSVHTVDRIFQETLVQKGLKPIEDPYGGDITGTWMASANLDPKSWTRSYAATAYYIPNRERKNLVVLTEATVARVLFADAPGKDLTATGVEFIHAGKTLKVYAKKEVILSAGAIKSPQILELSGIGRKEILENIGVECKIDLRGVGQNVQDHTYLGVSYELNPNDTHETYDLMRNPEFAAEAKRLHSELKGMHRIGITSFAYFPLTSATSDAPALIKKAAESVDVLKKSGKLEPGQADILDKKIQTLKDDTLPDLEIIAFPGYFTTVTAPEAGKSYVTILIVLNHPLSHGTIHATSNDPFAHPAIDPASGNLVQHIKYIRSMKNTEPWKSSVVREMDPGPNCQTDEDIRKYIYDCHGTCWHTIGSTSMLPLNKQGVVSPELKVYGTNNLRVVDVGIIPIHLATHTHATAYVIAEKAADLISGRTRH